MVSKHLTEELKQFENQEKPNKEDTETVNLGDEEVVKETRIRVHHTETQKEDLIILLKHYINVFCWSYDDMPGLNTDIVFQKLQIN